MCACLPSSLLTFYLVLKLKITLGHYEFGTGSSTHYEFGTGLGSSHYEFGTGSSTQYEFGTGSSTCTIINTI